MKKSIYFIYAAEFLIAVFCGWCACAIYKELPTVDADDVVFYVFGCIFSGAACIAFIGDIIEDFIKQHK